MKFIATLHNRRGAPLLLLNLLKALNRENAIQKLAVAWSVPSGNTQPTWEELSREEKQLQETLRSCVRMVHESSLSWDAKSFLGRCYRSFQYEYMVVLNLKRHRPDLNVILLDQPEVRDLRYNEIGRPLDFLKEIEQIQAQKQAEILSSRYSTYKAAYHRVDKYEEMLLHPDSALLEADTEIGRFTKSREEYMAKVIKETEPQIIILRLMHCLSTPSPRLVQLGLTGSKGLPDRLSPLGGDVMKLSEAESLVGQLPERD